MPSACAVVESEQDCQCQWRNVGFKVGVLEQPTVAAEVSHHLKPGAVFTTARVAAVAGRRYLQLADGSGWVPECSRKDPSRVVICPIEKSSQVQGRITSSARNATTVPPFPEAPLRVRHLRVTVTATRADTPMSTQLSEIRLRCRGKELGLEGFTIENPQGNSPPREGPEKLLFPSGKWLDSLFRERGQSVLLVTGPMPFEVDDVAFRTANDQPNRDPVSLRVDGSLDGWEWRILHEMVSDLYVPVARRMWTPWFQLRPDSGLGVAVSHASSSQIQPDNWSWWLNTGTRLDVFTTPEGEVVATDHVEPDAFFAAARVMSVCGRRFLQLPGSRGWVLECGAKLQLVGMQDVPAAVADMQRQEMERPCKIPRMANASRSELAAARMQFLRLSILSARSANVVSTQISQVCLRCSGEVLSLDGFHAENPNGQSPASEGPEKVLAPAGKWLDMNFSTHSQSVLLLTAPCGIKVDDLAFCTGNDIQGRDPVHIRVDASCDGSHWSTLHDTGPDFPTPTGRRTWSPWLLLCADSQVPAAEQNSAVAGHGAVRHRCLVEGCTDAHATSEGYLVQGKLLRHMLCKHPEDPATKELHASMHKSKKFSLRRFARRTYLRKHRSVKSRGSTPVKHQARAPPTKTHSHNGKASKSSDGKDPQTPQRPVRSAMVLDRFDVDLSTPSPMAGPPRVSHACLPRLPFQLSAAAVMASVGKCIDVEAVVESAGKLIQRQLHRRPGASVQMRRFILRDGEASCFWVLCGRRAAEYGQEICGRRIVVYGAKVHEVQNKQHLSGGTHFVFSSTSRKD